MKTRTFFCAVTAACLALLTVGAPAGRPQPVPTPADAADKRDLGPPVVPLIPPPDLPTVPGTQAPPTPSAPSAPATKPAPAPPTVDQLLAELEAVQKQKADLIKQEEALKAKLQERLKDQQDRLKKVGVVPAVPASPSKNFKPAY